MMAVTSIKLCAKEYLIMDIFPRIVRALSIFSVLKANINVSIEDPDGGYLSQYQFFSVE